MLEYQRDIPKDSPEDVIEAEKAHVRDHLASLADNDDDPTTHAGQVKVWTAKHPDDPNLIRIEGALDAEIKAPYLEPGYDPLTGVDLDLLAQFPGAMGLPEEAPDGQA